MLKMALDNPSYFTIPGGNISSVSNKSGGRFTLLRKHITMGTGPSSASTSNISMKDSKKNERYSLLPDAHIMSAFSFSPESFSPPVTNSKKNFRSLLRPSIFDSSIQTQMLVLGMPRPSDIAPANHNPNHLTKKQHNRNASTGKSYKISDSSETPRSIGNLTSNSSPNDCVLSVDSRYYNMLSGTNFLENSRRHSIGAYFNRKGITVSRPEPQIENEAVFCEDGNKASFKFSQIVPRFHKKNTEGKTKKSCGCCSKSKGDKTVMEDIVIISSTRSEAADLWANYLKTCFDQIRQNRNKSPFRILVLGLGDSGTPKTTVTNLEEKLKNAKLVICIVCPVFLECATEFPDNISIICKYMRPDGVLAMLLGIEESTINDDHKLAFLNFSHWKRMASVKDRDEKFVGDFLGAAMDIISKNITQQNQASEKGAFMLMPKKVNKNQNKVLVLLNEPIVKEDTIRVTVARNSEVFEILSVKKRNPYTLIFRMPEEFFAVSSLVSIRVERNGADLGTKLLKCESQLYALVQILKSCDNPVEFMCQALNIVPCDKDKLDDYLVSAFQKNVPPNFNLLQSFGEEHLHKGVVCHDEYPTLLHFAARHGLEKLCWMLLECPGGELACDIRNSYELTPSEIAESSGHTNLASALSGFMQMTEFTSVYTFLKGMSDVKNNSKSDISDDYLNPRPVSETYQVPPSPRPLAQNYSNTPLGYMEMHSPKSVSGVSMLASEETGSSKEKILYRKNSQDNLKRNDNNERSYIKTRENSGNGIQDELIEIINDFKNNVFTISEVEKLVEDWRNRNDVQQSFREKQEQLNKMREEYERVQQKLKDEMKQVGRPSPMERIRKFFRSKNKDVKASDGQEGEKKLRQNGSSLPLRPSSGLSIQSSGSSSSGRLSTGSHCSGASLGDSGTHSDTESERKVRSMKSCISPKIKDSLNNYDIPPSPVCLMSSKSKVSNGMSNYDIPPSPILSETGYKSWVTSAEDSCPPCHSQSNEANYYNLIPNDIPIPNQSTLHGRLVGGLKSNLLVVEESTQTKTEKNNCSQYINLPSDNGNANGKCLVMENNVGCADETSELEFRLPDYVNVENSSGAT